ncbi:MAG: helix-turn-helix transcriptional regulator, partial [Dehalococcoidia bacterium]|nr:helix-turn-helix transcriptional regulator [Dehalococcoidia bacterium]
MARRGRGRPPHPDVLTPAEWRVLGELRTGATNAEIAVRLGVGPDAVKFHISNMLGKLSLNDRHELAAWRPAGAAGRLRALLALPIALGSLARPLVWAGAGTAVLAGVAAIALVLVFVSGSGEPVPVVPPATPMDTSPTATGTPSPQPSPVATAVAAESVAATPMPVATSTATPVPATTPSPTPSPTPPPTPGDEAARGGGA